MTGSPWFSRPPRRSARVRLFCLPHSGGGASLFQQWQGELPAWVDVLPLLLPGRDGRAGEPPPASLDELAVAVTDALRPHLDTPFALFGHSLGALLAYQVTLRLQLASGPAPVALLVAGLSPPGAQTPEAMHELSDDELLDRIFALGGTPEALREDQGLLRSALPALRTDVTLFCTHRHRPAPPLDCPVVVFGGQDDPLAPPEGLSGWAGLVRQDPPVHVLPGGHFFVRTRRPELTRLVKAELRRRLPAVTATREAVARAGTSADPVAVIGIGCRFPGARGPEAFWRNLVDGVDAVTEVPAARGDHRGVFGGLPSRPSGAPARQGGFLDDVEGFDAAFFGISPREAERMDPQQRLLLEVAWEALEDALIPPTSLAGTRTGVFIGQMGRDYWELQARQSGVDLHTLTGSALPSFLSGRLSFALDLRGPSMSVDTACSSSLLAVHLARQSLRYGDSDLALAGGVNLVLLPELAAVYEQVGLMSQQGRCRFADASADGFVRSEGAGIVVLKPLDRALADGDRIYAVLEGSGSNNDGSGGGSLVAPAQDAQEALLTQVLERTGIRPSDVDYVEAHGTGTTMGDAVELRALHRVFGGGRAPERPCLVGSVKTNIGHTEGAAGVSGLIKTVLSLHHGLVPANPLLTEPNPVLAETGGGLRVPTEPVAWPPGPRPVAGVTSFGLSGTNVHVVLTAAPGMGVDDEDSADPGPLVLPLSARDPDAALALAAAYAGRLDGSGPDAARICAAAARGRAHHDWRLAVSAADGDGLAAALRALPAPERATAGPRVAFVFPGHGSQWTAMGRELFEGSPVFRAALEDCETAIKSEAGWSVVDVLTSDDPGPLERTEVIQPAVWAMETALARLWESRGVRPDVVFGHSFGEVAAAQFAGAIDLGEAARLICRRAELTRRADGLGGMVAVALSGPDAEEAATRHRGRIVVAARNGPRSTVLSGETGALNELLAELRQAGVRAGRVRINFASHSIQMDPLRPQLVAALAGLRPRPVSVPLRSTVTGELEPGPGLGAEYWGANLRAPVRFAQVMAAEAAEGRTVFLEISPHPVLVPAMGQCLAGGDGTTVPTLYRDQSAAASLAAATARLYSAGVDLDWRSPYPRMSSVDDLPTYPWQREHTWFTPTKNPEKSAAVPEIRVDILPDGQGWNCVVSGNGDGAAIRIGPPEPAGRPPAPVAPRPKPDRTTEPEHSTGDDLPTALLGELGTALGLPAGRIPRGRPLREIGCDSLAATEIRARLAERWGADLPASTLLGSTVDEIVQALATKPEADRHV